MRVHARPTLRRKPALLLAAALGLGTALAAPVAHADDSVARTLTDAEFRWGVNVESSTKGHAPGTFNFLYAGDVSPHLPGPNTQIGPSDWSERAGDVSIERRAASGSLGSATWADTQRDRSGAALAVGAHSGLEMVFSDGTGTVDPDAGTAEISWDGTASIVYYSGFVYMTLSDPVLSVSSSGATVTATMGGHRSDREDTTVWEKVTPREVTIADLPRDCIELGGEEGFAVSPEYFGVTYDDPSGDAPQETRGSDWGSFPAEFVEFAEDTGSGSFWYSSGGVSDPYKAPSPISVGWGSGGSDSLEESCESASSGGSDTGVVGRVVGDTVEDILRAAGADVADTAAAWMDEAWKPLQPEAVQADREGASAAAGASEGASGGAEGAEQQAGGQVDDGDAAGVAEDEVVQYVDSGAPVTAGTVGAAVAAAPASSGNSASASGAASGAAPVTDQATIPVSAHSPLAAEAVYAAASQDAGGAGERWQWWVGAILLALAAVPVVRTLRQKG